MEPQSPTAFEFATAARIVFGAGRVRELGTIAKELGDRALIVIGSSAGAARRAEPLQEMLSSAGVAVISFRVEGEPTLETVRGGAQCARQAHCNLVIGFGGGSVVDAGKAMAALLSNGGDPLDYVEVIGKGRPITKPSAPYVAIPTTAGTGAEVTRNAVLGSPEHRVKVSMRSPHLLPRVALVDSALTRGLPKDITARTGLDALTQLIEAFVCARSNPMTDAICREGMHRAARSLLHACEEGDRTPATASHLAAREDMAVASLFSGLALANAGLGAVHGFAAPLGGMFPAPHGAVCAALLPHVMEINAGALQSRQPQSPALRRYDEVARILTGQAAATARDAVAWTRETCRRLRIPPLGSYGVRPSDFPVLIENASQASSMRGNPVQLTADELRAILQRAL